MNYGKQETQRLIQAFFSARRDAMLDLAGSLRPLFGRAQWIGLKNAPGQTRREMERIFREENAAEPYAMLEQLDLKYRALGNSLLMRLVWQTFMFLHEPFFSIRGNVRYFDQTIDYLPTVLELCQNKNWTGLRAAVEQGIEQLSLALTRFYAAEITAPSPEEEIDFHWSSYKKSGQLCYSFAMELLISISRGVYPVGSLLPSQEELARQKGVSVSTVRRAFELLSGVGAVKPAKYVGTRVLPLDEATENSDFTKPVLQRRLLDMVESLQIFVLSCKEVSQLTLSAMEPGSIERLCRELREKKAWRRGETLSYFLLDMLGSRAPYRTIRTVYSELLRQFFWAYALRGMEGSQEEINAIYDPYFDELIQSLEKRDFLRFSLRLEELMAGELDRTVGFLVRLEIPGAGHMLIPETGGR